MRSFTVLVPMYNETVYYTRAQLVARGSNKTVSEIEFLVEKYKEEFNNLAERTGYPEAVDILDETDGLTRYSRALLDRFLASHSSTSPADGTQSGHDETEVEREWQEYEWAVCEWASLRGQTLARTVRGLSQVGV